MENTDFPEWFVELMIDRRRSWLNGHGRLVEEYFAQDQRLADDRSLALDFILGEFCLREDLSEKPAAAEYLNRFPAFAKDLGPLFVAYSGIQAQESASQSGDSTGPHYENPPRQSNRAEGSPGSGSTRIVLDSLQERPGSEIGPYKLMEQIGVGGFGLVFVAEQQRPVHRRVALKVIKPGMDSHDVIARFEAERQALALMDHPNIARVLDGGATDSGRPYFVMELVRGIPITDYCDQHHLALRERLNLFVSVCHAVQHAHQKGIIHRDIKPSNVMVTVHDGQPVVKVIDFGVAKALHQPLTEKTVYTRYSQMIGTPLYMSPEQAEMSGLDIDTRSDIYSLGVLLYELLTGTTPLERKRLSGVAYDELLKIIRNDEPPKPSSRLQQLTKLLPATAARRKADAAKLPRMFRGDLDSITMKALEKDRTRRYETASGLAADIVRYLNDEPVEATPPSTAYRLKKLARRYRAALVTAAAFVGLLVAGVIVSTWFALLAAKHAKVASSEADNARRAGIAAEAERQRADASAVLARQRREEAEDEKNRAQAALNRSEWLRYESHLSAAQREWETHNAALAHQHLDACRWDFRGWEHDFLYSFFTADHRVLGEHQEGVRCVAYQRTGRLVASGSVDKSVKIWDANSGKEVATLRGHAASVLAVAFSPDSTRLASGDGEGSVKLWDVAKGVLLYSIAAPGDGEIRSIAFSPDGRQIAGGGQAGSILVWDAATGKKTRSLAAHSDAVDGIAFSPDGRQIASVGEDQLLKLWDAANGKLIRTFKGHSNHVFGVGFSPDGRMIVSGGMDRAVRIWETSTGTCLRTLSGHTAAITCVGFLPDGEHVASGSEDSTIRIWNVDTGIETKTFTGHAASINDLAIAPDGREIVSASDDWTVRIWELKNERTIDIDDIVQTTPASSQLESAPAPRPDKERAGDVSPGSAPRSQPASPPSKGAAAGATAIPGSAGSVISHPLPKALAPPTKQPLRTPVVHWPRPHLSPDGRYLALAGLDKSISLWNTEDCSRFQTLNGEKGIILAADFSPDGSRLATGDEDGCVKVWDIHAAQAQLVMRGHSGSVGCVVFSQDGKKIASGGLDASVRIWDSTSGREMAVFKGNGSPIWAIAFSPVGDRLGAGRMDGTIQCWDSARGRNAIVLAGHRRPVTCLAYSPDGRRIASGSDDQTVRCWDATNGRELLDLAGDFSPVTTVIFSPDGRRILSSSPRSSIKVWDANSGLDLLTVKGDNDVFSRVAFSRDLRQFVSTADGFIKVWRPIHQQEVLRLASTARITNVAFAPDGQRLACATAEGTVTLSSASSGQESLVLKGHSGDALCVAFNRDGTRLASGGVDKTVRVWDAARGREVIKLDASTGPVATVTFSPNGTSIACGGPDGTVRVWDPSSRQEIAALKGHTAAVTGVAFSPDGKRLASGSADRTVRCWDLADPRKLIIFRHPAAVTSVAFSPDGKRLVSGGSDGVAWVWDASTGRQTLSLKGHKQSVSKVAFSPDGTWIVSGSLDRAVKLWDAATGAEILTLRDYADPVIGLAVSPDGKRIALVNRQGAADVWMLPESINGSVVSER